MNAFKRKYLLWKFFLCLNKLHYYLLAVCLLLLGGCRSGGRSAASAIADQQMERITLQTATKTEMPLSRFAQSIHYTYLETTPESLVGGIDKLETAGGRYFIMDMDNTQSLTVFETTGAFRYRLRQGRGQGEFASLNDFSIDEAGGVLYILDATGKRIHRYRLDDGRYLSSLPVADYYQKMQILPDGYILLLRDGNNFESSSPPYQYNLICRIDSAGAWDKGWQLAPINPYLNIGQIAVTAAGNDDYLMSRAFSDTLYRYHGNEVVAAYLLEFEDNPLPAAFYRADQQDAFSEFLGRHVYFGGNVKETADFMFIEYVDAQRGGLVLYDKQAKTGHAITLANDIDGVPISKFDFAGPNQVIAAIRPVELELLRPHEADIDSTQFSEILQHTDANSNPVLAIITLLTM